MPEKLRLKVRGRPLGWCCGPYGPSNGDYIQMAKEGVESFVERIEFEDRAKPYTTVCILYV